MYYHEYLFQNEDNTTSATISVFKIQATIKRNLMKLGILGRAGDNDTKDNKDTYF